MGPGLLQDDLVGVEAAAEIWTGGSSRALRADAGIIVVFRPRSAGHGDADPARADWIRSRDGVDDLAELLVSACRRGDGAW